MTGARSWTGPALAWPLWPRSSEGQGQGHYICGPDMEGQGQVRQKSPGPGPDRPSDSLHTEARNELILKIGRSSFNLRSIMTNVDHMKALATYTNRTKRFTD
jgi:hypothetical protein